MVNSHGLPQARDCSQHPQSAVTFQASLKPVQKFLLPSPAFIDEDFPGLRIRTLFITLPLLLVISVLASEPSRAATGPAFMLCAVMPAL